MIAFPCPQCSATLKAPESKAGSKSKCPRCGAQVEVPPSTALTEPLVEMVLIEETADRPPPSVRWHYDRGGQQVGPLSQGDMHVAIRDGRLRRNDLVWRNGLPDWEPAHKHFEFAEDSNRVRYNRKSDTFIGSLPAVMKLAMKAVQQLGYRISNANETLGLLSFEVGTQLLRYGGQFSLYVEEVRENTFCVRVEGFQSEGSDLGRALRNSWKPKEAEKVIDKMIDLAEHAAGSDNSRSPRRQ